MLRRLALRALPSGSTTTRCFSKLEGYKNPRSNKFSMTKVRLPHKRMCLRLPTDDRNA